MASPVLAVPFDNRPKILLHVKPPTGSNACGSYGQLSDCTSAVTQGDLYPPAYFVYVLVARGNLPNIGGAQFGIWYESGAQDATGIDVFSWTLCATLQFPSSTWPEPGSGNLIAWELSDCQSGETAVAGYFYIAAYNSGDTFRLTPRPVDAAAKVAVCLVEDPHHGNDRDPPPTDHRRPTLGLSGLSGGAETLLSEADLGTAVFSAGANLAGCNPCVENCGSQNTGACCLSDSAGCMMASSEAACLAAGGTFYGVGTPCPDAWAFVPIPIVEGDGSIFIHSVLGPRKCRDPLPKASLHPLSLSLPAAGPHYDAWISNNSQTMCHNFSQDPIPADFFAPGSEPYSGSACLRGEPLGGPYGNADTIIERDRDPFSHCLLPSSTQVTVSIKIIELSLVGTSPITVMVNGQPQQWDVAVDLSIVDPPAQGTLTATKTHCNGGTYTSSLPVQPRFTFRKVGNPSEVRVLDTGVESIDPVILDQPDPLPWASDVGILGDPTTDFHPGFEDDNQTVDCDEDNNGYNDDCPVSGADEPSKPFTKQLLRISPNPFRGSTRIQFNLVAGADAEVHVFDVAGRSIKTLHEGQLASGPHQFQWDGTNENGRSAAAGVYIIRVRAASATWEAKVVYSP